ncbi:MarR family transcriptional regulator [Natrinema sp. 1APR25-10V2]|uniref:helix-turn-helix domain-containing protein n=1 Tax=Natrinema sp. 1APR25-10V2 TaxID=2951081 RepID=UPI002876CA44|nr:MarR family transcriptional regulator [Natrinema sp. 1APR25-10V2]MDS0474157.1 helix-turn-helix domain-containing protein [Natrinema sp. 1APR25-10V2]
MTSTTTTEIDASIPTDLDSARAKLVYLYLAAGGSATAEELCDDLAVSKGTVLSITGTLRDRGYLERRDGQFELA